MIKIKGQVDTKGAIRQLELSGHAGAGEYGEDIVCACSNKQQEHDAQVLLRHLVYALEVLADNYPEFIHLKINQAK